mmetsp:Transcript_29729/g.71986  ORF Transcript_29729/g.71986 Transcript_29729/m.71986 type:complete len:179 (-) Transcript_29729:108-644(-)
MSTNTEVPTASSPAPDGVMVKDSSTATTTGYVQHGERPPRQSHTCCGVCCDTRTAVLIVNIISIGFGLLGLITLSPHFAEPDVVEKFGLIVTALVVGIICNSLALYGSLKFNKTFVMVGLVWFCIESILSLVLFLDFIGAAVGLAFAYPHFFLFKEIRNGVMTTQTYPNEKSCCDCCV